MRLVINCIYITQLKINYTIIIFVQIEDFFVKYFDWHSNLKINKTN